MRKNVKNKNVIRAIAIGISAMLMSSTPLSALAAEGKAGSAPDAGNEGNGTSDGVEAQTESGVCDDAQQAASDAEAAISTAMNQNATFTAVDKDTAVTG